MRWEEEEPISVYDIETEAEDIRLSILLALSKKSECLLESHLEGWKAGALR